ncbi:MAG: TonB-dependent receptor, partial [Bacteroidales bacterium]|nr:TonB-dependent receptor [Bacteroidales bacterium]
MSRFIYILILALYANISMANTNIPTTRLVGKVTSNGEEIPYATIIIKGTTIGTASNVLGEFNLEHIPSGKLVIRAQAIGYKPEEIEIEIKVNDSQELSFDLEEDVLGLAQVVITADRNEKNRTEASVIVNTITPRVFEAAQTVTIADGLNFCPGIRMENNCSNCGFNQVRMNGMEGPYSQILINSRPIFSGLAGVYGLELIPTSIIERIEVVRGGGSALYGSNAIAGTINLILKDPINNSYEASINEGIIGVGIKDVDLAQDYSVNLNTSLVSDDNKTGMVLYGFYRDRQPFDANEDDFSELASIKNTTIGTRIFRRIGYRGKLAIDFFNIKEERRGGNKFDLPQHEADVAESAEHDITTGAITYDKFFRDEDLFSLFVSAQNVNRDSYYGAGQSLKDYGFTNGFTYTVGTQYSDRFNNSSLILGIENRNESLNDIKLGYLDIDEFGNQTHTENNVIADQISNTFGFFMQYEFDWKKFNVSAGARFDNYFIEDKKHNANKKTGNVISPRLTLKYDVLKSIQVRASYSQGYRAPQIFDEDLHILSSESRKVIHKNDPDLKQETSHSYMASLDFNKLVGSVNIGFLAEGFYTQLNDAFANETSIHPTEENTFIYTRVNSDGGAMVNGVNFETKLNPDNDFMLTAGFTIQKSEYDNPQVEFNEKSFFRTPNQYGYITIDWDFIKNTCLSATGNYTGSMLVPYYGPNAVDPTIGELRESNPFFDMGAKLSYDFKLNNVTIQAFGGIKNIFNSYQNDLDVGGSRDPGYV